MLHVEEIGPSAAAPAAPAGDGAEATTPLVVFVHGSMDRLRSFARLAGHLSDCRVIGYDRRGYARSRHAEPPAGSLQDHASDLISVLGGRPALVLGHSYGAVVALAAAQTHPDLVRSVVAYEPPLPWFEWWHAEHPPHYRFGLDGLDPGEAADQFVGRMVGPERYARIPERFRAELRKDGPAFVTELKALRDDPPPFDPAEIRVRVLVVRGSESVDRHVRGTSYLASALPDADLAILEGAGHGGHVSHPALLADLVHEELARGGAAPARLGNETTPPRAVLSPSRPGDLPDGEPAARLGNETTPPRAVLSPSRPGDLPDGEPAPPRLGNETTPPRAVLSPSRPGEADPRGGEPS